MPRQKMPPGSGRSKARRINVKAKADSREEEEQRAREVMAVQLAKNLHALQVQLELDRQTPVDNGEEPANEEVFRLLLDFEKGFPHRDVDTVIRELYGHLILRRPDGTLVSPDGPDSDSHSTHSVSQWPTSGMALSQISLSIG